MSNRVRITFDQSVQDHLDTEDIVRLSESLYSFIEHGLIDCEENEEFHVDSEYLQDLVVCITALQKASKKYGRDDEGLIKYPFKDSANGN
jgi:hypothetical protein